MDKLDFLLLKFTEYMKANGFAERTIESYAQNVGYYTEYLKDIGIENIAEADQRVISDYQSRLYLQNYKGKPLSASTRQLRLTCIRTFYRYLLKAGLAVYDPTANMDLPKTQKHLPKGILSKKEIGTLLSIPNLDTVRGIKDRAILEVLYSTGIRVTELCNLTLADVDLRNGELRVNRGKGSKDRIIPLGEVACDFLELYLREARPKQVNSNQPLLFVNKKGRKYSRSHIYVIIKRYGKKASIKASPHQLRHTCATHLLKGKADIRHIQQILGHASIATTQKYTKVEITDLKRVMKRCHPREKGEIATHE
jgi:integrase/recombinase XerD